MEKVEDNPDKYVEFADVKSIKSKSVRGLLKKRAKQYDSDSGEEVDAEGVPVKSTLQKKKKVNKKSLADAFKTIMNKKIDENPEDQAALVQQSEPILAKYKKRAREVEEERVKTEADAKKRAIKEKQRLMGRVIPTKLTNEKERELAIIATKGVVQLFNAVTEFQGSVRKEAMKEEQEKKEKKSAHIQSVGKDKNTGAIGFGQNLIEKIQSNQRRWKVLASDSEDEDGNIKIQDEIDE